MSVRFLCPNAACQSFLEFTDEFIGQQVRCSKCDETCVVPSTTPTLTESISTNVTPPLAVPDEPAVTLVTSDSRPENSSDMSLLDRFMEVRGLGLVTVERQGELARGGMGAVIRGLDRILHRPVAVKVMQERIAASDQHRLRFIEEAQVTGQLEHPNIVPVHELGKDTEGNLYFTMKLVQGRSLGQILKAMREGTEPGPPLSEMLSMFLKVCDGMAFAHSRNVIHRDLKPDNIMVGDFGEVLVMDWGLARIVQASAFNFLDGYASPLAGQNPVAGLGSDPEQTGPLGVDETQAIGDRVRSVRTDTDQSATIVGTVIGTPAYMPPEQAAGELDSMDQRSDIYSLGGVLYAILTLKRPIEGKGVTDVLAAVSDGTITPPDRRAPDRNIPVDLSAIVMKAMRHDRRERYQTVRELAGDIQRFQDGRTVSARRDSLVGSSRKLVRRNPKVAITAACAALVLAAVTGGLLLSLKSERDYALTQWQLASKARAAAADAQREQFESALSASEELARQAIRAEEQGRPLEADLRADAARTLLPDGPWGHYALAAISHERHDHDAAQQHLKRALEIKQTHGPSRALLSSIHASAGEMKLADRLLDNLDDIDDWHSMLRIVKPLLKARRYEDGLRVCERLAVMTASMKNVSDGGRDKVEYLLGYAKAEVACIGFPETLQGLSPEEQKPRVLEKFRELHGGQDVFTILSDTECRSLDPRCIFLQPLRGTTYTSLFLGTCQVRDLEPLRGQPLEFLEISQLQVTDLDPLRGMPLKTLNLRHCEIDDLTPLKDLTVESMTLYGLPIDDLSPLSGLPLKTLYLTSCGNLTDVTPLAGVPLTFLHLGHTGVSDLSPLRDAKLTWLVIGGDTIKDLSPIANWPLETIQLVQTSVKSIDVLKNAPVKDFTFLYANIEDVSALKGKPLHRVVLSNSRVRDISGLENAPLVNLAIDGCSRITDFSVLKSLSSLVRVQIGQTKLTDLSLVAHKSLLYLDIRELSVTDLSPLSGLELQTLILTDTPVTDLTPLAGVPLIKLHPPPKEQLTPESLAVIEQLKENGCKVVWD